MAIPLKLKHGSTLYDVQPSEDTTGADFKKQASDLTEVPADRIKIVLKGAMLKDDVTLAQCNLVPNQVLIVIGTKAARLETPPPAPAPAAENVPEEEDDGQEESGERHGGLRNFGNTCYLNATVQTLSTVRDLAPLLKEGSPASTSTAKAVITALSNTIEEVSSHEGVFSPFNLVSTIRRFEPQFAERMSQDEARKSLPTGASGVLSSLVAPYAQQDAQELFTAIMRAIQESGNTRAARLFELDLAKTRSLDPQEFAGAENVVPEEPDVSYETLFTLPCNITIDTNFMTSALAGSFSEPLEKFSPSLNRTARYIQKTHLTRLPPVITVNFVRFFWRRDIASKTKIMRRVQFPIVWDTSDLVAPELAADTAKYNTRAKEIILERTERFKVRKRLLAAKRFDAAAELGNEDEIRSKERDELNSLRPSSSEIPSTIYILSGIITHKGASANGGHYVSWIRDADSENPDPDTQEWLLNDDEDVYRVPREHVRALEGGSQNHIAYVLLYQALSL